MTTLSSSACFLFSAISEFNRLISEERLHHHPPSTRMRRRARPPNSMPTLKLGRARPPPFFVDGGARLIRIMRSCPRRGAARAPLRQLAAARPARAPRPRTDQPPARHVPAVLLSPPAPPTTRQGIRRCPRDGRSHP